MRKIELSGDLFVCEYCILNTHIHIIFGVINPLKSSKSLQYLFGSYAHYFNSKENRFGPVWAGRFDVRYLDREHFLSARDYVRNNPVEAKIVERARDYQWSSARCNEDLKELFIRYEISF